MTVLSIIPVKLTITAATIISEQGFIQYCYLQGTDSEGDQIQRQNKIARNSHTVMEIDMESEGRDINPPPLEAKINQEQKVILRHTRGKTISIVDWRKFWKELDTDLKLDAIRLLSHVSDSELQ
ncbi:MAG: hypothetical protein EZS28_016813 [Streblomastix strix]|uniref:Uncharacterized protein n=1 Tax=Streblomastix strix TaxID=222440 RepID=A0A5J4VZ34_9EUKA|nr:MAG: hypothetical protein EZS28_016813 [Streblomastix strix]